MVIRVAGLAYQKGFGGHFHNDNSIGALRDIPGLILCVPSRGDDAARMLRGCISTAKTSGRVICSLEPIALYHEKDLYEDGDSRWLFDYPPTDEILLPGEIGLYHPEAKDLLIVSYANGLRLSLRAAKVLQEKHGIESRVLDLRWLNPLPLDAVKHHAEECGAVLVADECRATAGGIADAVIASLAENDFHGRCAPSGPSTPMSRSARPPIWSSYRKPDYRCGKRDYETDEINETDEKIHRGETGSPIKINFRLFCCRAIQSILDISDEKSHGGHIIRVESSKLKSGSVFC
ncbi:MAG: hypothetical protein IPL01_04475 [Acidobacteria bacterium]|nr:hypothetical protein [Acidobacteriota bacterium]